MQFKYTEPVVDILLATYNGAAYLPDQLNSLLRQTYTHWRVLAHDDGSTDGTVEILQWYLENEDWVQQVQSGSYRQWIDQNYNERSA